MLFVLLAVGPARGQVAHLGVSTGASTSAVQVYLPRAAYPTGLASSIATPLTTPVTATGVGGVAVDPAVGRLWTTDGNTLVTEDNVNFNLSAGPSTQSVLGALSPGGLISGLAIDRTGITTAGVPAMIMVDTNGWAGAFTLSNPMIPVGAARQLTASGAPIVPTGLGFDPGSGSIWVTTGTFGVGGNVYNYTFAAATPSSTLSSSPITINTTGPGSPILTGCTVNAARSVINGAGPFPPSPACAATAGGFNVLVSDLSGVVYDAINGGQIAGAIAAPSANLAFGLGSCSDPQILSQLPSAATISLFRPMTNQVDAFIEVAFPPSGNGQDVVLFFVDLCPLSTPSSPSVPGGPFNVWFNQFSPTLLSFNPTPAGGLLFIPLPTTALPHGIQFMCQAAAVDTTAGGNVIGVTQGLHLMVAPGI